MLVDPLTLNSLALRIEMLTRTSTHRWEPADEMEFQRKLPNSRYPSRDKLPDPVALRQPGFQLSTLEHQQWLRVVQRLEDFVRDNDPRNPRKMMRDLARGRFPGLR